MGWIMFVGNEPAGLSSNPVYLFTPSNAVFVLFRQFAIVNALLCRARRSLGNSQSEWQLVLPRSSLLSILCKWRWWHGRSAGKWPSPDFFFFDSALLSKGCEHESNRESYWRWMGATWLFYTLSLLGLRSRHDASFLPLWRWMSIYWVDSEVVGKNGSGHKFVAYGGKKYLCCW